jgi:lipoprotein-releasing system permease protein
MLTVRIAKTHLFAKKRQTVIASLGVTFGIAMFILMVSFMTGVNRMLEDTMLSATPHIRVFQDVQSNRPSIVDELEAKEDDWNVVYHMKAEDEQLNLKNGFVIADRISKEPGVLGVSAQRLVLRYFITMALASFREP